MKITVTKEDIANGKRESCCECPIAQALTRMGHTDITVDELGIEIGRDRYTVPKAARLFIFLFDNSLTVHPFEFNADEWEPSETSVWDL